MVNRLLGPSTKSSYFIFGARGTGKSTLVKALTSGLDVFYINLLQPAVEDRYARSPGLLTSEIAALKKKPSWIVIDEVQKVPRLLDEAHDLIESGKLKFILTGSSARKLKRGSANLLAGRAFWYELFPLTSLELGKNFELIDYLHWGGLPQLLQYKDKVDKAEYLRSYVLSYLNEEIRAEQIVRNLDPFRNFLEVAAQSSGKIINHKKIADQIGSTTKTVQSYFQILEDTLLGFYLPAFHQSIRKSQLLRPKFYFFDTGVKKAIEGSLEQKPVPKTSVFGELFETMVILECFRLNSYKRKNFKMSYFATKNDFEIDLILTKGSENHLIEIKSTDTVDPVEVRSLARGAEAFGRFTHVYYVSQDPRAQKREGVTCIHWQDFLNSKRGVFL